MTDRERNLLQQKSETRKQAKKEIYPKKKANKLSTILQRLGNRTVQRLVQRRGEGAFQLDEDTAGRINRARGSGAPLDSQLQMEMSDQMGFDLSGVRVHNSPEADTLNRQLSAKAFTTGQDIFFKEGSYNPQSSSGRELISHELTHVVQQGTGQVKSEGGMTVNAPGDQFEQAADGVAKELSSAPVPSVQTQETEEEEEELQLKPDESAALNGFLQRQEEEEEEELQLKRDETAALDGFLQRQEEPEEEEELQLKRDETAAPEGILQRDEEEEPTARSTSSSYTDTGPMPQQDISLLNEITSGGDTGKQESQTETQGSPVSSAGPASSNSGASMPRSGKSSMPYADEGSTSAPDISILNEITSKGETDNEVSPPAGGGSPVSSGMTKSSAGNEGMPYTDSPGMPHMGVSLLDEIEEKE